MEFKEIEHTADLGIEVWGNCIEELFLVAAKGMYSLSLFDPGKQGRKVTTLSASGDTLEELLISFLTELNYQLMVRYRVIHPITEIKIAKSAGGYFLNCQGKLRVLTKLAREIKNEIKAVTYHQIEIKRKNQHYSAKIFFDI